MSADKSRSFYFFDIDDNLLFLPTQIYLWNAETRTQRSVTSGEFAAAQSSLGRPGPWQSWSINDETFRDFRDDPALPSEQQKFVTDLIAAVKGGGPWHGPAWPLLEHAARSQRAIALVTARGHDPRTIEAGLQELVSRGLLSAVPPILGIYTVSNSGIRSYLGVTDPAMTIPSIKKLAIQDAVERALDRYGRDHAHRFGMSDDDPNNFVLAISAMRECKTAYPDKRFFVINTNHSEYVKLEIFAMDEPVTAKDHGRPVLSDTVPAEPPMFTRGGNTSIYVTDMNRAVRFYTEQLGLPLRGAPTPEWVELDVGMGMVLGLHLARPPDTVAAGVRGAINVELAVSKPLDLIVTELKARGVAFKGDTKSYPAVRIATLFDPDGNEILLVQILDGEGGA